jgi:hypothetical protein
MAQAPSKPCFAAPFRAESNHTYANGCRNLHNIGADGRNTLGNPFGNFPAPFVPESNRIRYLKYLLFSELPEKSRIK